MKVGSVEVYTPLGSPGREQPSENDDLPGREEPV